MIREKGADGLPLLLLWFRCGELVRLEYVCSFYEAAERAHGLPHLCISVKDYFIIMGIQSLLEFRTRCME